LAGLLGPEGAAALQAALLCDAVRKAARLRGVARYLFFAGRAPSGWMNFGGRLETARYVVVPQRGADLGERLKRAFRQLLGHHPSAVVMGTDSPALDAQRLRQALDELSCCEAVLGPCPDGGYYLIGLRRFSRDLFRGVRWGTSFAFQDTLRNLMGCRFSCSVLEALPDIDRPADFRRLAKSLSRHPQLRRLAPATWSFVRRANDTRNACQGTRPC
jgi:rSAM/selenodomain-associated transferase 1